MIGDSASALAFISGAPLGDTTPEEIVAGGAPPISPAAGSLDPKPSSPWRSAGRVLLLTATLVTALALWGLGRQSSYMLVTPGPTPDLVPAVVGDVADPGFGSHGRYYLTTVQVSSLTWIAWLREMRDPDPHRTVIPKAVSDADASDAQLVAIVEMREAQSVSSVVAVAAVSGGGLLEPDGALITAVRPESPAERAGLLRHDTLVTLDGDPVRGSAWLRDAIIASLADDVTLGVERDGKHHTIVAQPEVRSGRRVLGVEVVDRFPGAGLVGSVPAGLHIELDRVGGPSGGLMFTLALVDALSPGDLTAGLDLAGTGTITLSGAVGPIAGVGDKVVGATLVGADVFFAPTLNAEAAEASAGPTIEVVAVDDYVGALRWLCEKGATDDICVQFPRQY